jgi:hypothetical protein
VSPTAPSETTGEAHEGILTATRGVHAPPEMRPDSGPAQRRYIAVLLVACVLLVAVVAAFNALIDPYAIVSARTVKPAVWSDRRVKVELIDRLSVPPETIILGSSRAMKLEPRYVTRLSGRPAFNAAVSGGKPVDAYVFTRLLHDRFPGIPQDYLWVVDQEAFAPDPINPGVVSTPSLSRYLSKAERVKARVTDLSWLFSWRTLATSWRTWRHRQERPELAQSEPKQSTAQASRRPASKIKFLPDGFRSFDFHDMLDARGQPLGKGISASRAIYTKRYRSQFPGLAAIQKTWFERTLALMNSWGSTPVLVLSPMHPELLASLRPLGWNRRHREVLAYLSSLRPRYWFVLIDMSEISSFGGSPLLFYDGVHMKVRNCRRLLRAVFANRDAASALGGTAATARRGKR